LGPWRRLRAGAGAARPGPAASAGRARRITRAATSGPRPARPPCGRHGPGPRRPGEDTPPPPPLPGCLRRPAALFSISLTGLKGGPRIGRAWWEFGVCIWGGLQRFGLPHKGCWAQPSCSRPIG
jgi:hypothetical protein